MTVQHMKDKWKNKYHNTLIYKIKCNNTDITETYIGHTTNFKKRMSDHRYRCNNDKDKDHHKKLYKFIRDHGSGWSNWSGVILEKFKCDDRIQAIAKEQEYLDLLNPSLNSYYAKRRQDPAFKEREAKKRQEPVFLERERARIAKKRQDPAYKEREAKKVICPKCSAEVRKDNLIRHQRSQSCMNFVKTPDIDPSSSSSSH